MRDARLRLGLVAGAGADPEAERHRPDARHALGDQALAGVELREDVFLHGPDGNTALMDAAVAARSVPDPKRWWALALLCSAYFMVILDVSIVNVALPSIQEDLNFAQGDLQWVLSAYALTFGGFLLLGGRTADLLGRRRVFMSGVALFTAASLLCGLSTSEGMLIGARAVQGLGAAILSPAALSIITTTFQEGSERNKALGIWGAMGGSGAAVGVLMGGVLTKWLGWEWIFFVNVPIGVGVLLVTRSIVRESRVDTEERHFDALGAAVITSALVLLVYALTQANTNGWSSAKTIGVLAASAVLHALFLVIEHRSKAPLVPLGIFGRLRTLTGANIVTFFLGGLTFAMFFMLSLYMQQVLGLSALQSGVGLSGGGADRGRLGRRRAGGGDEDRRQAGAPLRARDDGARQPLVHAGLAGRLVRGRPPPRLLRDRDRARLLVRARLDRRPRRRHAARGGPRVGPLQHVAADRRRARRRRPVDGRDQAQRRLVHPGGAHARVQHRVLGCGRLCDRGARRDADDDPPGGDRGRPGRRAVRPHGRRPAG